MSEEQTTVVGQQQSEAIQETTQATTQETGTTFLDTLPEDIRTEPSLKNFTNTGDLAKSFIHAQRMVGMDKIPVPGKHATEEDWQSVYNTLGRPSDPNEYKFDGVSFEADDPNLIEFKKAAHDAGLNPNQANKIMQFYEGLNNQSQETLAANEQQMRQDADLELRKEFGLAFDRKIQQADDVFKKFFPNELKDQQLANGNLLGNDPSFIKALAKLADNFSEDDIQGENSLTLTPENAQREIQKLTAPGTPYWDKKHPGHQDAVDEVFALQNMKHGIEPE
jgi:hypothetical protein